MKIITGVGEVEHVTSDEHRALFGSILGQGTYILNYGENLDAELVTNTRIKAKSGMMMHKTNVSYVKAYDEIDLQPGTQGMKRIDLVVNRYEKIKETGVEKNTWVAIMGVPVAEEPVAPAYIVGDILNGDLIDDCPVYEVEFDGINIVEIRKILTVVSDDISGLMKQVKNLESQKQDNISGAASTITKNNLTSERVVITDANGKITISSITKAVLEFLSGVTSNIQTQLNGKSATHSHPYVNTANVANNLTTTASGYALDARQGKALNDKYTSLNSNITKNGLNQTFVDLSSYTTTFYTIPSDGFLYVRAHYSAGSYAQCGLYGSSGNSYIPLYAGSNGVSNRSIVTFVRKGMRVSNVNLASSNDIAKFVALT